VSRKPPETGYGPWLAVSTARAWISAVALVVFSLASAFKISSYRTTGGSWRRYLAGVTAVESVPSARRECHLSARGK
jgi:predicted aminopeptidase